ncbi:MAG: hypothetical protein ACOX33_05965 [Dethiobacteria bacterium]|jgi:hypothetical protein
MRNLSTPLLALKHYARNNGSLPLEAPGSGGLWPYLSRSGEIFARVKRELRRHRFSPAASILVKAGGLGDFVQMTPIAKALKVKNPASPVVAVISSPFGSLFQDHPYIDLAVECRRLRFQEVELVKNLTRLAENVFDLRYVSRVYGTRANTKYFYDHAWHYYRFPASIAWKKCLRC